MDGFEDIQYRQYFEDFLNLQAQDEVFVDVGGFDGYTSMEFIKRCPNFNKIYFLEPDSINLQKANDLLKQYSNIEYLEIGASNKKETLRFENEQGSSSKVSDTGSIIIEADAIDNVIHERVTYIKMDIEGSEAIAIEGATQTILKYHPRLAICVYHKVNDLIDIPNQVLAIRNDYDIFLRHYTEGVVETVMFFIPKK
jgi:FkbM family methyltransferase